MTPAMMLGVADYIWSVGELIEVAASSDFLNRTAPKFAIAWTG